MGKDKGCCGKCKYFEPINDVQGNCLRFPPKKDFNFPKVRIDSYCAEYLLSVEERIKILRQGSLETNEKIRKETDWE